MPQTDRTHGDTGHEVDASASSLAHVLIVEDHPVVAQAVKGMLLRDGRYSVDSASNGGQALAAYRSRRPDVVLCDLSLGKEMSGIELTRTLRQQDPDAVVVVFTSYNDHENVLASIDAGACGYLTKTTQPDLIPDLLWAAHNGEAVYDPATTKVMLAAMRNHANPQHRNPIFTPRELELLTLLCEGGGTNAALAEQMFLSESTIGSHLNSVFAKLGVKSRSEAIAVAYRTGLVQVPGDQR